jgi:hypothetical protein
MKRFSDLKREKRGRTGDKEYDRRRLRDPAKAQVQKWRMGRRWRKLRKLKLDTDPLCERCLRLHDRPVRAVQVHHQVPALDDPDKFFDYDVLESVCYACHAHYSAQERAG